MRDDGRGLVDGVDSTRRAMTLGGPKRQDFDDQVLLSNLDQPLFRAVQRQSPNYGALRRGLEDDACAGIQHSVCACA
jgi:hypothetical protein